MCFYNITEISVFPPKKRGKTLNNLLLISCCILKQGVGASIADATPQQKIITLIIYYSAFDHTHYSRFYKTSMPDVRSILSTLLLLLLLRCCTGPSPQAVTPTGQIPLPSAKPQHVGRWSVTITPLFEGGGPADGCSEGNNIIIAETNSAYVQPRKLLSLLVFCCFFFAVFFVTRTVLIDKLTNNYLFNSY